MRVVLRNGRSRAADISRPVLATLVGALAGAAVGCQPTAARWVEWNDAVVMQIEAWRAEHEETYTRNWVPIEGLHFLKPGTQRAGSAPDMGLREDGFEQHQEVEVDAG